MHAQGGLPIPDIDYIGQPYWYQDGGDLFPEEFGEKVADELEQKILELGVDNVAAFIGEPIQGAGGVITDWRGRALGMEGDGTVLAAGDHALHAAALEVLTGD